MRNEWNQMAGGDERDTKDLSLISQHTEVWSSLNAWVEMSHIQIDRQTESDLHMVTSVIFHFQKRKDT